MYSEKTCPSATFSTTNSTFPVLGSNPDCRGGKPVTNRMSAVRCKSINVAEEYVDLLPAYFMLISCFAYSSTLKMEATCSSERSVGFQRTA
jgi:hypothetical protein